MSEYKDGKGDYYLREGLRDAEPEHFDFTVDSLAAAIHDSGEVYADCRVKENQDDLDAGLSLVRVTKDCEASYHRSRAAAIIQAAKEAERE